MERIATIERYTSETKIKCTLNLDGSGKADIHTGIGFFDHMMNSFARHGFFDLSLQVEGDLEVDTHHTVEDTGIVLGQAIAQAVGDKKGITRYGSQILPMDEALVMCALDLCGRPYLVCDLTLDREKVGDLETEMVREFFLRRVLRRGHEFAYPPDVRRQQPPYHRGGLQGLCQSAGRRLRNGPQSERRAVHQGRAVRGPGHEIYVFK